MGGGDTTEKSRQLTFEGLSIEAHRATLGASVLLLTDPIRLYEEVTVVVKAVVAKIVIEGDPPTRMHVLKPFEGSIAIPVVEGS